mgnify:FL=1|jgi:hypothetical protein
MTRWRAVGVGFTLAACSEALVFTVTGRVTLIGGLAGSALAGYMAGSDPTDGAWHGLLTAMAWGIVLIPGLVALSVVADAPLPFPIEFLLPLLDTAGEATALVLLSASLPNVVAGALGSLTRREDDRSQTTEEPAGRPGPPPSDGDAEDA